MLQAAVPRPDRNARRSRARLAWSGRGQDVALSAGILLLSALAGLVYSRVFGTGAPAPGLIYGLCIGGLVHAFDRGWLLPGLQGRIRTLPAFLYIPLAEAAYIVLIAVGTALAGAFCWATGLVSGSVWAAVMITPTVLLYSLAVSALIVFVTRMRDLLGTAVFGSLLIGRYYRPVREPRIFLFLDVEGSTAYAERHGDLRAQEYLAAIFAALAEPVRRSRGAIADYVGDMAMVTWPFGKGAKDARCVACIMDFLAEIERDAGAWQARFGQVPRFRGALHGGPVVTAEIGVDRHKISYFGDVLNATGRMEALCRTLEAPILISSDLLHALPALPSDASARPLGEHAVKGRGQKLSLFAIEVAGAGGHPLPQTNL